MSVGSGIAASLGLVAESTYGTYVAPTRWLPVDSAELKKIKNTQQGGGLAAGRFVDLATRRVVTTLGGEGSFNLPFQNKQMGLILNALLGGTPTVVQQGATTAYLQTHTLNDNVGKFYTMQVGVPDTAGTVRPYSFVGSKVTGLEFTSEINGLLMCKVDVDSRDLTEAQSLATPSYATGVRPFHGVQLTVKVGATTGAAASVSGVAGVTCSIRRPQKTDRYYAGAAGLKAEPLSNAKVEISGTITADFTDKTIWADRFAADTQFALILEWVGPVIDGAFSETFRITLPANFLNGETPTVGGEDVVRTSFPFVTQFDGTNNPVTVEYMSVDTAI